MSQRAHDLIKEGRRLAAKGAIFSAQTKFDEALELISDTLDAEQHTHAHNSALKFGMIALREVDDFFRPGSDLADPDPAEIAATHSTKILKGAKSRSVSRVEALQLYCSFATSQFAVAVDRVPEASHALCQLGRLQPYLIERERERCVLADPKARSFFQASLLVDPENFHAANELGVILARCGELETAKKTLLYSASLARRVEIFQNLAAVYKGLGDENAANGMISLAVQERSAHPDPSTAHPEATSLVYWVDHKTFVTRAVASDPVPPESIKDRASAGDEPSTASQSPNVSNSGTRPRFINYLLKPSTIFGQLPSQTHGPLQQASPTRNEQPVSEQISGRALQDAAVGQTKNRSVAYQAAAQESPMQPALSQPLAWDVFAQGEYIGPARLQHVPQYFLRVDDTLSFVFRLNGKPSATPYRLNVGDVIRIGSLTMPSLNLETVVQPDGTIVLPQVGSVGAAGKSIDALRTDLEARYRGPTLQEPSISVSPVSINKTLEELRNAIVNRQGVYAGQSFNAKVTPAGTVQLPAIGPVHVQGLTLTELRNEIEPRYAEVASGIEITPVLVERAPRSIYVLGEVAKPGKFPLDAPTTVIQAIAMAGSWNIGGNTKCVIVFRRDEQWRLMATQVNVYRALYNRRGLEANDIWLRDSDIVIVPKCAIRQLDDVINLVFTSGIYSVFPISFFTEFGTVGTVGRL
jgi:polysaccharide export outer membrane protein